MSKDDLLKHIADTGYNVGFGAKKHFATYDIVCKVPGLIGTFSTLVGVYALVYDTLSAKGLSATLVALGIVGLMIAFYDKEKDHYEDAGKKLTQLFNRLKVLYSNVKDASSEELEAFKSELNQIEDEFYKTGISKQILFSGWFAHLKFFGEHQIDWIDEQKHFKLLKDKIPASLSAIVLSIAVIGLALLIKRYFL